MRRIGLAILVLGSGLGSQAPAATPAITNGAITIATVKKSCPMKVAKPITDAGIATFAKDRGISPKSAAQILDKAAADLTARLRKEGKLKQFCDTSEGLLKARIGGGK